MLCEDDLIDRGCEDILSFHCFPADGKWKIAFQESPGLDADDEIIGNSSG